MDVSQNDLYTFLEQKYREYHANYFIEKDPIQIPHKFHEKADIEIAAFITATIAWGQRKTIIKNAHTFMELMDFSPYEFILHASAKEIKYLEAFKHRTFNGDDAQYFIYALRHLYLHHGGLEGAFSIKNISMIERIVHFRTIFFAPKHPIRTQKHISNPLKNSACKRLNMFLRWMVRDGSIDFGLWQSISPSDLLCPLDVHSGTVARKLGLLKRTQNDLKACLELTESLIKLDPKDPIKYDLVLFGLGAFENF